MSLLHRRRNSISCPYFSWENVNRQNNQPISERSWWPLILTPIYTYVTYALVRHLFKSCNAYFSKEKCQIMYSSSTSLWWRYREDLPFGYGTPKERLMRTFFDHAETEKMSRNDVTVDHQCNSWFLNKLYPKERKWKNQAEERKEKDMK